MAVPGRASLAGKLNAPKLKTKSAAKKRFKTAAGKFGGPRRQAPRMLKRTKKQIRQLRGTRVLFKTDGDNIEILLAERRIATRDQGPTWLSRAASARRPSWHVRFSAAGRDQADIQSAKCQRLRFLSTRPSSLSAVAVTDPAYSTSQ
jgi:large subunit ribosomal protein L35